MPAPLKGIDYRTLFVTLLILIVAGAAGFLVGLWLGS